MKRVRSSIVKDIYDSEKAIDNHNNSIKREKKNVERYTVDLVSRKP